MQLYLQATQQRAQMHHMDFYTRIPGLMAASYRASVLVLVVVTRCGYAQSLSAFTPTQTHRALLFALHTTSCTFCK